MIDLRWTVPPNTSTLPPVLQYRRLRLGDNGHFWEDWQDVPTVVLPPPTEAKGKS